jgi:ribosomal protein S12 methylthiotransferase accessory factor
MIDLDRPQLQIQGTGPLADAITAALAGLSQPALIQVGHGWEPEEAIAAVRASERAGLPLLHVRADGPLGIVGPLLAPGARGCAWCAEAWRRRVLDRKFPQDVHAGVPARSGAPPALIDAIAAVARSALTDEAVAARLATGCYVIRATDLAGRLHRFTPHLDCPVCDRRPLDSPVPLRLTPRPQTDPVRFRSGPDDLTPARLREVFADWRYGQASHIWRSEASPMCLVSAEMVRPRGDRTDGYGRDISYPASELVAVLEALERSASSSPTARRTAITAAYRDVATDAIDLERLGLHEPASYGRKGFRFAPYSPDTPTDWVWAWSFGPDRPVLVPEHVGYVQHRPRGSGSARFLYESSNGCAIGHGLEEAILYGLCEVIERDAFLLSWYARLPAAELDLEDPLIAGDLALGHQRDRLEAAGFGLHVFKISIDHPIPAVMSLAVANDQNRIPQAFFAAGAHPDPGRAIRSAVAEVVTNLVLYDEQRRERPTLYDPERLAHMLAEPDLVVDLEDHVGLHTLPQARDRYAHLLAADRPVLGLAQAFGDWRSRWLRDDLTDVLRDLLGDFRTRGLEVVVVDQTDPDHRERLGLRTVKVIVPGTLPMTFGHVNRRLRGLPRLTQVPASLGYPVSDPWASPDPHPFP